MNEWQCPNCQEPFRSSSNPRFCPYCRYEPFAVRDLPEKVLWDDNLAPLIKAGDDRVMINGAAPLRDCRIISEENFQLALKAVNALVMMAHRQPG